MGYRVLIVEDDPVAYESLAEYLLRAAGSRLVGWATGEQEARELLAERGDGWDVAIVDLFLAEGSGLGVLAACQQRRPGQQVVVLTNYATAEMRERCLALGAVAVFDKVTQLRDLIAFCRPVSSPAPA